MTNMEASGLQHSEDSTVFSSVRSSTFDVLRSLVVNNVDHFRTDESSLGKRLHRALSQLLENLNGVECTIGDIVELAPLYDVDENTPGNGYRSYVEVVDSFIIYSIRLCRKLCVDRGSFLFRKTHYTQEVEAHQAVMGCLKVFVRHLLMLNSWCEAGNLFPGREHSPEELLLDADDIDTSCFYGRCLGFQFCESMRMALKVVVLGMAAFSDAYYGTGGAISRTASTLISCGQYLYSPEMRAKRVMEVAQKGNIDFIKSFWLLQETALLQQVPVLFCPILAVNKVITLPLELLQLHSQVEDKIIDIPIPMAHLGPSPVVCRLLSASVREGQLNEEELKKLHVNPLPPSPHLIIQCHGGGFVAQSSKSHEVYLRDWAVHLDVPIFCIDYSLAPDAAYPRALEECVYVYAWAINNAHHLGSTASKIILVGDSAGGNLMVGLALKTIDIGIRQPDGILTMFTPFLIEFIPSPSRLLCLMDPLIPFSFMMQCLKAYAGKPVNEMVEEDFLTVSTSNPENGPEVSAETHGKDANPSPHDDMRGFVRIPNICDNTMEIKCVYDVDRSEKSTVEVSDSDSFEEVSALDVIDMQNHSSHSSVSTATTLPLGKQDCDTLSTVSLCSNDFKRNDEGQEKVESHPSKPDDDFISEFMSWCVLDVDHEDRQDILHSECSDFEENILFEMPTGLSNQVSSRIAKFTGCILSGISGLIPLNWKKESVDECAKSFPPKGSFVNQQLGESGTLRAHVQEFYKFKVSSDPYLSPYTASDATLRKLPPISLVTLQLDPCLDDSVMFCRRLKNLGVSVHLDILDGLPHGFLNFSPISKEAHQGSLLCVKRLKELLQ